MKKLLIQSIFPAPYRLELFEQLKNDFEIDLIFETTISDGRNNKWFKNGDYLVLKNKKDKPKITKILKNIKKYDFVMVYDYSSIEALLLILKCIKNKIDYGINCDGAFINHHFIKDRIKRYAISQAAICFANGRSAKKYFLEFGAREERIYLHNFSSLHEKDILETPITQEEKKEIRKELNIKEKKVVLAVGQFIPRKGFDILLKVACELDENIGIYIVGGEATKEYIDYKEKHKLENIHFDGFKSKEELAKYYKSADLFVLPTREDIWGLVINEAMAYGLPVITTDRCIAGLELITNGENGYVVPVGNVDALTKKIQYVLNNAVLRSSMEVKSLSCIHDYTIENMASSHISVLQQYLVKKR